MSIIIKDSEKFYESLTTNSVIEIAGRKRNQYACLMTIGWLVGWFLVHPLS